jgi:hypothetical protein
MTAAMQNDKKEKVFVVKIKNVFVRGIMLNGTNYSTVNDEDKIYAA